MRTSTSSSHLRNPYQNFWRFSPKKILMFVWHKGTRIYPTIEEKILKQHQRYIVDGIMALCVP